MHRHRRRHRRTQHTYTHNNRRAQHMTLHLYLYLYIYIYIDIANTAVHTIWRRLASFWFIMYYVVVLIKILGFPSRYAPNARNATRQRRSVPHTLTWVVRPMFCIGLSILTQYPVHAGQWLTPWLESCALSFNVLYGVKYIQWETLFDLGGHRISLTCVFQAGRLLLNESDFSTLQNNFLPYKT